MNVKQNQKGSVALIAIMVIVLLVVSGAGYYMYSHTKQNQAKPLDGQASTPTFDPNIDSSK